MAMDNVQDIYPLAPMQAGMLYHTLDAPESGNYLLQIRVTLVGPLQMDTLETAWDDVVQRHDALRAVFVWEDLDEPLQVIRESVRTPWAYLDGAALTAEQGADAIEAWTDADRLTGFDLKQAPLMRVTVIKLDEGRHLFVWTLHHLLADAWSVAIVMDELKAAYHARLQDRPFRLESAPSFRDFIAWMKAQDMSAAEEAWRRYLSGFSEPTRIDLPTPAIQGAEAIDHQIRETRLSETVCTALNKAARDCRVTQTALFKCAWAAVLNGYAGSSDLVFGLVVSGRTSDLPGAERAVGLYINAIPTRVRMDKDPSLRDLVQAVHADSLTLRTFENTPLGKIQSWSEVSSGTPLFNTLLIVENHPTANHEQDAETLRFQDLRAMDQSNYPLVAFIIPDGGTARLLILFDPCVVPEALADRILAQFKTAIEAIPDHLDKAPLDLPNLPQTELNRLIDLAEGPAMPSSPYAAVHHRIAELARRQPDHVALLGGGRTVTYGELEERSTAWARHLMEKGVARGDRVALLLERGPDVVIAMLAVMKAGGAYVPLDITYPQSRIRQVLEDCQPKVILTTRGHLASVDSENHACICTEELPSRAENPATVSDSQGDDPVYVIYTSGSTGKPKGGVISQANLAYSTQARLSYYPETPDVFLLLSSFAFDSSVVGLYWTLTNGGTLVISEPGLEGDSAALAACIADNGVTHTLCLPSLYDVLLEFAPVERLQSLRCVIVAGEACPPHLPTHHRSKLPKALLYNEYGPTEASVWCSACEITSSPAEEAASIGRPIPGANIRLLTHTGRLAPEGAKGEIWIGGPGVGQGYWRQPEATAEVFADPMSADMRLYRSGDVGRYRPDGTIEFLGRRDRQVKIRGHRIETDEVENALRQHPAVQDAVVVAVPAGTSDSSDRLTLAAFVRTPSSQMPDSQILRDHVRATLPAYMVPATVSVLESFPHLPNGKVDVMALRQALSTRNTDGGADETGGPRNDFEKSMVRIWKRALGLETVGIHDDFFSLGGDSIASIKIVALAQQDGIGLIPSEIFDFPSIATLSQTHAEQTMVGETDDIPSPAIASGAHPPFIMVHGGRRMIQVLSGKLDGRYTVHFLPDHRDSGDVPHFSTIETLTDSYLEEIHRLNKGTTFIIGGYSVGAPVATEVARRLKSDGQEPSFLFLLDPPENPHKFKSCMGFEATPETVMGAGGPGTAIEEGGDGVVPPSRNTAGLGYRIWRAADQRARFAIGAGHRLLGRDMPVGIRHRYVGWVYEMALRRYELKPYDGRVLIFHGAGARRNRDGLTLWAFLHSRNAQTQVFDATHLQFRHDSDVVEAWTKALSDHLDTH